MIPQPDNHILTTNPQFAALYRDLQKTKLTENGGSKITDPVASKARVEFEEALYKSRVEEAKKEILRDTLRVIGYKADSSLPPELQQVIQIVSAQLDGRISDADREVVNGEVEYFTEEISKIAPAMTSHIEGNLRILSQVSVSSSSFSSPNPKQETNLTTQILHQQSTLKTTTSTLNRSRAQLATQTAALLTLYTTLFETLIRILEQVIHGSVARHTRAQAAYLCAVAQGMEKKLLVLKTQVVGQVYDGRTRALLVEKMEDVQMEGRRVMGLLRRREGMLEELESKGRGLEKVVEDVKAVKEEIGKVREEVERLEAGM